MYNKFTFYYTYLATMQYYRDDAKGSEGQRLPQSLNIKTRNISFIQVTVHDSQLMVKGCSTRFCFTLDVRSVLNGNKNKVTSADSFRD